MEARVSNSAESPSSVSRKVPRSGLPPRPGRKVARRDGSPGWARAAESRRDGAGGSSRDGCGGAVAVGPGEPRRRANAEPVDENSDRRQALHTGAALRPENETVGAGLKLVLLDAATKEHVIEAAVAADRDPAGQAAALPGAEE
jgi:hypothetical protein